MTSRALNVLSAFDAEHPRLTLSEIARRSNTPVATCHRLVSELVEWGALARGPGGRYHVGHRLWSIGMLAPVQTVLRDVAAPYMHDVLFATQHVVNLFVIDRGRALVLERISGTAVGKPIAKVGERLPLHSSAGGKVLLAWSSRSVVEDVLANMSRDTPRTIIEPPRLLRELERVREQGYATTQGEHALGASALAVPVLDEQARVIAALGVVFIGPARELKRAVPALQVAAQAIARGLQHG